jgi:hypothetical protein
MHLEVDLEHRISGIVVGTFKPAQRVPADMVEPVYFEMITP